jgi:hypothetical protein
MMLGVMLGSFALEESTRKLLVSTVSPVEENDRVRMVIASLRPNNMDSGGHDVENCVKLEALERQA